MGWPWLILWQVKLDHLYVWMGKMVTKSFNGGKLAAKDYIDWIILWMKKFDLGGGGGGGGGANIFSETA